MNPLKYDLIVIGGGSGGISCARESAKLGAKVALFDHVAPTPMGRKWGLGGTCVNVGCIPKKLMHYSAQLGSQFHNANKLGWSVEPKKTSHSWQRMIETVQNYIKSLNFGYKVDLMKNKVVFYNHKASFVSNNIVKFSPLNGTETFVTAPRILISTGGRPRYPSLPDAMTLGITSDDIFSLEKPPGKTLIVGASYIALETAGFLTELGYDVTVAVRSIVLRGFDRQCAEKIKTVMKKLGTKFYDKAEIIRIRKNGYVGAKSLIDVFFSQSTDEEGEDIVFNETFNTVLFAVGRDPNFHGLNIDNAKIVLSENGKIKTNEKQETNVPGIYAIGDVIDAPELTPVAIQTGLLLARRMFGSAEIEKMNFSVVPTTIFTPIEYGCIGHSEEDAIQKYGEENINIYISSFNSVEIKATGQYLDNVCLAKLICLSSENDRVIGFHYVGPNAGEITGGYAVAMKMGATKKDFDGTVGIHPTAGEVFSTLRIKKRDGENYEASGC